MRNGEWQVATVGDYIRGRNLGAGSAGTARHMAAGLELVSRQGVGGEAAPFRSKVVVNGETVIQCGAENESRKRNQRRSERVRGSVMQPI